MLSLEQMIFRLMVAIALGAILGIEREFVGKEIGLRTEMLVTSGAAMFAMIGLALPYLTAVDGIMPDAMARGSAYGIIANIVVGIGFLGAGLIIKTNDHPHNVTTAALIWATAAIGILVGVGLITFAIISTLLIAGLLYAFRSINIAERRREPVKRQK